MKTPIKVLYIEDDELDQQALLRFVRQKNLPYDLTLAQTLAQARTRLAESHFDLILADYHLPDGHSTALFAEVADAPFILMTGTLDEQLALRTLQRGADDYLPKDPKHRHLEALPLTVEKVLYRHRLRGVADRLTRELHERDRRTRLAQEATGVGTFEWDIPHNRVTWSPELERLYGLPPGGFGGRYEVWLARVHPEDRPETERQHQRALSTGRMQAEWRVVWPDGTVHWLAGRATVEMDADGKPLRMLGVNIDITDRKRVDLLLAAARDQLTADLAAMERLHELSTRFVTQGDLQTLLDAILDSAIAITGASKGNVQLLDAGSGELGIAVHRGFAPAFIEFFSHIRAGQVACGTAMQTRQCVIVEDITLSPLFLEQPRALQFKLAAGVRAITCTPLLTRSGEMIGVLSVHFPAPHRPTDRDLRLLDLLARQAADFIERTRAETALRAAKEELAHANQDLDQKVHQRTARLQEAMAELEHMSYSMIHDMRAPLRAMETFASLAEEACTGCAPETHDYFRRIRESTHRLDHLVTDALNYNKLVREELPTAPIDLGSLLRGMIATYPNLHPSVADIHLDFQGLHVLGNESLLTQAFGNLLGNAVKFVAPGVRPRVRLWAEPSSLNSPPGAGSSSFSSVSQPSTLIYIQDNGIGIPKDAQEKIFRMFQRMHRETEYPGTGVGLPIARKAVERMRGRVGLESDPGHGSKFWVELLAPTEAQATEPLHHAA